MFADEQRNPTSLQLRGMIERACDAHLFEPNMALNLDICDFINQKQLGYPREAALLMAGHANSRSENEGLLALALLDCCAKNCGAPFHMVMGTKEFLNSLVRRFPERPTSAFNPVQDRILALIELWRATLCQKTRYASDLRHIDDMYQLLLTKGYRFPGVQRDAAAVLSGGDRGLRSEQELEAADHAALSAKLQVLLAKGTPGALEQANEIMKVLAGYEPERKPDYAQQVASELDRIHAQTVELNDTLNGCATAGLSGASVAANAVVAEQVSAARAAQPKVQALAAECADEARMERLLQLNDSINGVLGKYEAICAGRDVPRDAPASSLKTVAAASALVTASLIDLDFGGGPAGGISLEAGSSPPRAPAGSVSNELSLLDFDPIAARSTPAAAQAAGIFAESNGLRITVRASGDATSRALALDFSNTLPDAVVALELQAALPRSMTLTVGVPTATALPPLGVSAAQQLLTVANPQREPLRVRYRVSFRRGNSPVAFEGEWRDLDATLPPPPPGASSPPPYSPPHNDSLI